MIEDVVVKHFPKDYVTKQQDCEFYKILIQTFPIFFHNPESNILLYFYSEAYVVSPHTSCVVHKNRTAACLKYSRQNSFLFCSPISSSFLRSFLTFSGQVVSVWFASCILSGSYHSLFFQFGCKYFFAIATAFSYFLKTT